MRVPNSLLWFSVYAGDGTPQAALPTYTASPTTSTFAEAPISGYRVLNDDISLNQWDLTSGLASTGDGAFALDASVDTANPRDQALKFATAAGTGAVWAAERLKFTPHNGERDTIAGSNTSMASGYWQCEFELVSGESRLFGAYSDADQTTEQFSVGTVQANGGFYLTLNQNVGSIRLNYGKSYKMRLSWDGAGAFTVQTKAFGGSWTTHFNTTDTAPSPVTSIRWGCFGATMATDIRFYATAIEKDGFTRIDKDFYLSGSGTRDTTQTKASMALFLPDGLFSGQTQARVRYAVGNDPSGGTAGAWVALTNRANDVLPITVTGLTAGTQYSYQFEIGDVSGNVLYTSDTYRFKTLLAAGASAPVKFAVGSCYTQIAKTHPYEELQSNIDNVDENYFGTYLLGDFGYEASSTIETSAYLNGDPPVSEQDFEQKLREFFSDVYLDELLKAGTIILQPDDHEWINDGDATHRTGGSNANTLANNWVGDLTGESYPAGLTLSELYNAGISVMDSWASTHWLDRPADDGGEIARYKHKTCGEIEIIHLDTRTTRTPTDFISPTQLAWAKTQIDNIAPTTKFVLFMAQAGFDGYSTKPTEGWGSLDQSQYYEFLDYCVANMPVGVNWAIANGDDHHGFGGHRQHSTTANPTMPEAFLGEVRCSGGSSSVIGDADLLSGFWSFDKSTLTATAPLLKTSLVDFSFNAGADNVVLGAFADGVDSSHILLEQPVEPQNTRSVTLTMDNAQIGSDNTAGTITQPILLVRSDLPDEMFDPTGGNNAESDGRDIRVETTGGVPLEVEIVSFGYDTSTNAGDGTAEIWVLGDWAKDAPTDFVMTYADTSGVSTAPDGTKVWTSGHIYHMADNTDSSGQHDLSFTSVADTAGLATQAKRFTPNDSRATAPFVPATGSAARTEIALVRNRNTPDNTGTYWSYGEQPGGPAGERWGVRPDTGTNKFRMDVDGGFALTDAVLSFNTWNVLAVRLPGAGSSTSDVDMFIDGVLESKTFSDRAINTAALVNLTVGDEQSAVERNADADIDELRFYPSALTNDEIATISNVLLNAGSYITAGTPGNV